MPLLPWFRPESGESGNPHIHGLVYVADNPNFEAVVKDEAAKAELPEGVGGIDGDEEATTLRRIAYPDIGGIS